MSRTAVAAACLLVAGAVSGCAGVAGVAVPGEIDVRTLEVGTYPVDAHSYDQDASGSGPTLEGMRMGDAVVPTYRIDPSLSHGRGSTVVSDSSEALDFLAKVSGPVLDKRGFVVGFVASGSDKPDAPGQTRPPDDATAVTNMVMRFPDETSAKLAARELEDADIGVSPDNRKLPSSRYPDAYVHWRPGVANVGAFHAHGEFVISLFIQRPRADSKDLTSWVERTLDAQIPALDGFRPTPTDDIDALEVDPDGLLARVVVADREGHTPGPNSFAIYGPNYEIHSAADESATQRLLDDAGVDRIARIDFDSLYRARDAEAASGLLRGLVESAGEQFDSVTGPRDVPGVTCLELNSSGDNERDFRFRCYVAYKRYVAVVTSDKEPDVRQKVTAQYALLANSL